MAELAARKRWQTQYRRCTLSEQPDERYTRLLRSINSAQRWRICEPWVAGPAMAAMEFQPNHGSAECAAERSGRELASQDRLPTGQPRLPWQSKRKPAKQCAERIHRELGGTTLRDGATPQPHRNGDQRAMERTTARATYR